MKITIYVSWFMTLVSSPLVKQDFTVSPDWARGAQKLQFI